MAWTCSEEHWLCRQTIRPSLAGTLLWLGRLQSQGMAWSYQSFQLILQQVGHTSYAKDSRRETYESGLTSYVKVSILSFKLRERNLGRCQHLALLMINGSSLTTAIALSLSASSCCGNQPDSISQTSSIGTAQRSTSAQKCLSSWKLAYDDYWDALAVLFLGR